MNAAKGKHGIEKGADSAVYGPQCKFCKGVIPDHIPGKEYCDLDCKNAYHKEMKERGKRAMGSKGIHYARLQESPRLQRLLKFLSDCKPHSTRDIIKGADICNANVAAKELRMNGFNITCTFKKTFANGSKQYDYQLIKHEGATCQT